MVALAVIVSSAVCGRNEVRLALQDGVRLQWTMSKTELKRDARWAHCRECVKETKQIFVVVADGAGRLNII